MIDNRDLKKVQKQLGEFKSKTPVVVSRALNRALTTLNKELSQKAREEYHLKAKTIKSTYTIKKANRNSLGASMTSKGKRLPIAEYKVTPRKKTTRKTLVKVAIKKESPKTLLHAFIVERFGNNVFERSSDSRLPIKGLYGPAIPQVLKNKKNAKEAETEAWKTYKKRVDHEVSRILEAKK